MQRLANKIQPGSATISKFNHAFGQMVIYVHYWYWWSFTNANIQENIGAYLNFCKSRVSNEELFQTVDLYEKKNPLAVCFLFFFLYFLYMHSILHFLFHSILLHCTLGCSKPISTKEKHEDLKISSIYVRM